MTNSRSISSGTGAASTSPMQRSTTERSLYTGIKIESFMRRNRRQSNYDKRLSGKQPPATD
jgi:hypothetical protein